MTRRLDFAVVGVQKSATTWIHDVLTQLPMTNMRLNKNEEYHFAGPKFFEEGEDWYWAQFGKQKKSQVNGCVSVDYIKNPAALSALKQLNPEIKIIVSLRNPVDRSISAGNWYFRKKFSNESSAENLLEKELENHRNGIESDIVSRSLYHADVHSLIALFGSNLLIVTYDEINKNPVEALSKMCHHLGISKYKTPLNIGLKPKKNANNKYLLRFQRAFPNSRLVAKTSDYLNQLVSKIRAEKQRKVSPSFDQSVYQDDLLQLIQLLEANHYIAERNIIESWIKEN